MLCKKVVAFFQLLAESQETGVRRLGVTQELLSLVTGLAHYLKLLIRICLQGALKLERETKSQEGLTQFLEDIGTLDERLEAESKRDSRPDTEGYVARTADNCGVCGKSVEDKCYALKERRFHAPCLVCAKCGRPVGSENLSETRWDEASQKIICERHATPAAHGDFVQVTRLQQYVHLLRVAHARLLATLRTSGALPHTSGPSKNNRTLEELLNSLRLQMIPILPTTTQIKDTESQRRALETLPYCAQTPDQNLMAGHHDGRNRPPTNKHSETFDDCVPLVWTSKSLPLTAGPAHHVSLTVQKA